MSPRTVTDPLVRDTPVLRTSDTLESAIRALLETDLPALPVADDAGRLAGIFGEREFLAALFPGYLDQLNGAGFITRSLESTLEKRSSCRHETVDQHMHTEHIDVTTDFSDAQVGETFLHHRVLILPVTDDTRITGVITRSDFFRALAKRFLANSGSDDA